eukprot:6176119-Pleurochrysis_carterae.AAC.2
MRAEQALDESERRGRIARAAGPSVSGVERDSGVEVGLGAAHEHLDDTRDHVRLDPRARCFGLALEVLE